MVQRSRARDRARRAPADGAGEDALAVLVGNSRALWPAFTAAHDSDPAIGDAEHPVDTFVARAIRDAIADASNGACGRTASVVRVFDAHDTSPGKLVAIQRAAHVAGAAHLDEKCHLAIHPRHGPWIALRALLVFDDIRGPDETHRITAAAEPAGDGCESARARRRAAFGGAEGYADPSASAERWQRWVAVRDAVFSGSAKPHPERYYEDQVRYHYNCQTGGDARARTGRLASVQTSDELNMTDRSTTGSARRTHNTYQPLPLARSRVYMTLIWRTNTYTSS